jgi:hypothetical protein
MNTRLRDDSRRISLTADHIKSKGAGLSAIWHVRLEDRTKLSAELKALDARLYALNESIRYAIYRKRYISNAEDTARGADELRPLLSELDRLMTRTRAVEAKLLLLQEMADRAAVARTESGAQAAATCIAEDDASARIGVEVHRDRRPARITG